MRNFFIIILVTLLYSQVPDRRVVAEWEPALGTMIRWPLGIPSSLVVELASEDILYVLVETNNQQNQATSSFNSWGVNFENSKVVADFNYRLNQRDPLSRGRIMPAYLDFREMFSQVLHKNLPLFLLLLLIFYLRV